MPDGNYNLTAHKKHAVSPNLRYSLTAETSSAVTIDEGSATTMNDVIVYRGNTSCGNPPVYDNYIGVCDYSAVVSAYGTFAGQPGYRQDADFNETNSITAADYSVMITNYGKVGPTAWTTWVINGDPAPE